MWTSQCLQWSSPSSSSSPSSRTLSSAADQVKRIYHDTKQAISECNFLTNQELENLLLTPDEEKAILTVNENQNSLIKAATLLRELHARFLRTFVLSAFDLTWDMITTPKRFEYAKQKELELYVTLMNAASIKQDEIKQLIRQTVDSIKDDILNSRIQEFALDQLNASIASKLVGSIDSLRNSYVGTLERCLATLEETSSTTVSNASSRLSTSSSASTSSSTDSINSFQLVEQPNALLALRQILNAADRVELSVQSGTSVLRVFWEKVKQILGRTMPPIWSMYSTSTLKHLSQQQEQDQGQHQHHHQDQHNHQDHTTINYDDGSAGGSCSGDGSGSASSSSRPGGSCALDEQWKKQQALDIIDNLSETRLAKSICSQFRARLKASHEQFLQSIRELELQHAGRLQSTEELRLRVRKMHAPRMAKYALESTSLTDLILYGMPSLEKEIGRGQYGVVYACQSWAGLGPCAVKSVVPPDDKHWCDLAMEFYYTRCIPEHERVVSIVGSVIDHSYGTGTTPAVLLIMRRLNRDLYSAIRSGLDWPSRLQVAVDVVEAIRFLHNQGLVHRDIKLKNILLDEHNRAKITDMGFCKPEAMMSGSVVGTPIHMSPELFSGRYDNSVDVYAFGILFWYICAGHVRLPHIFEQCQTRDQLWNCVRRGVRPERLAQFDPECWQLMVQCWDGDRARRPLLGEVEIRLRQIHARYTSGAIQADDSTTTTTTTTTTTSSASSP